MPGWHLHFISADRQSGEHVLDFTLGHGEIVIQHINDFYMELSDSPEFAQADLDKDQSEAIDRTER